MNFFSFFSNNIDFDTMASLKRKLNTKIEVRLKLLLYFRAVLALRSANDDLEQEVRL